MKFTDIRGFILDLDGVISNTSVLHSQAWQQIAHKVETPWHPKLAEELKGVGRMDSLNLILRRGRRRVKYSLEDKVILTEEKNKLYIELVNKMTPDDILPGIKAFLDSLKANHYPIALASASRNAPLVLEKLQLTDYFDQIVDPAKLRKGKPDPEIFATGAKLLGLLPEECIGIEDSAVGITAINAAGETSIGIGARHVLRDAHINFADTRDLTLENIKKRL